MSAYVFLEAIAGIVWGLLFAIRTKKSEGVVYGALDKVGRITNIILVATYACISPLFLFIGILAYPAHDGFLGVIGMIVAIIIASAIMLAAIGLGASVALRKKGKSKLSFAMQFAGVASYCLSFLLFAIFYGNLLVTLN